MTAVTVNDNVFALLEDPIQPGPFDVLQQPGEAAVLNPSHYRQTYVTLSPPGALEQLLSHLKARWVTARNSQTASSSQSQPRASQGAAGGNQLTVEGYIYAVGTDWIVRAGNVTQVGGTLRGMLLEAEYLPLPVDIPSGSQGTPELLSNFITSMIPLVPDARIHAVTIGDAQWEEVLYNQEEAQAQGEHTEPPEDDVFCFGDDDRPVHRKGDWVGIDRDRRSAYAIVGGLRMEGLL
ncbi:hypothetical protein K474DRAFT_1656163 [Panus rudis PR-1116 ss-1]|nr:hypothetical protein K474DRAFT_1656163 [Panus rudis PR-1116 ss-1]